METNVPLVAVISSSMQQNGSFNNWWETHNQFYLNLNISKEDFETFPLKYGFDKGDVVIIEGKSPEDIKIGDVIVFNAEYKLPIIHRVVYILDNNGTYYFTTKGDQNTDYIFQDLEISQNEVIGVGVGRIPFLGWLKMILVYF